jgi:hypothetical protein
MGAYIGAVVIKVGSGANGKEYDLVYEDGRMESKVAARFVRAGGAEAEEAEPALAPAPTPVSAAPAPEPLPAKTKPPPPPPPKARGAKLEIETALQAAPASVGTKREKQKTDVQEQSKKAQKRVDRNSTPNGAEDQDNKQTKRQQRPKNPLLLEGVVQEGYLLKKGKLRHNWKRRYFVLEGSALFYCTSDGKGSSSQMKGELDLKGASIRTPPSKHGFYMEVRSAEMEAPNKLEQGLGAAVSLARTLKDRARTLSNASAVGYEVNGSGSKEGVEKEKKEQQKEKKEKRKGRFGSLSLRGFGLGKAKRGGEVGDKGVSERILQLRGFSEWDRKAWLQALNVVVSAHGGSPSTDQLNEEEEDDDDDDDDDDGDDDDDDDDDDDEEAKWWEEAEEQVKESKQGKEGEQDEPALTKDGTSSGDMPKKMSSIGSLFAGSREEQAGGAARADGDDEGTAKSPSKKKKKTTTTKTKKKGGKHPKRLSHGLLQFDDEMVEAMEEAREEGVGLAVDNNAGLESDNGDKANGGYEQVGSAKAKKQTKQSASLAAAAFLSHTSQLRSRVKQKGAEKDIASGGESFGWGPLNLERASALVVEGTSANMQAAMADIQYLTVTAAAAAFTAAAATGSEAGSGSDGNSACGAWESMGQELQWPMLVGGPLSVRLNGSKQGGSALEKRWLATTGVGLRSGENREEAVLSAGTILCLFDKEVTASLGVRDSLRLLQQQVQHGDKQGGSGEVKLGVVCPPLFKGEAMLRRPPAAVGGGHEWERCFLELDGTELRVQSGERGVILHSQSMHGVHLRLLNSSEASGREWCFELARFGNTEGVPLVIQAICHTAGDASAAQQARKLFQESSPTRRPSVQGAGNGDDILRPKRSKRGSVVFYAERSVTDFADTGIPTLGRSSQAAMLLRSSPRPPTSPSRSQPNSKSSTGVGGDYPVLEELLLLRDDYFMRWCIALCHALHLANGRLDFVNLVNSSPRTPAKKSGADASAVNGDSFGPLQIDAAAAGVRDRRDSVEAFFQTGQSDVETSIATGAVRSCSSPGTGRLPLASRGAAQIRRERLLVAQSGVGYHAWLKEAALAQFNRLKVLLIWEVLRGESDAYISHQKNLQSLTGMHMNTLILMTSCGTFATSNRSMEPKQQLERYLVKYMGILREYPVLGSLRPWQADAPRRDTFAGASIGGSSSSSSSSSDGGSATVTDAVEYAAPMIVPALPLPSQLTALDDGGGPLTVLVPPQGYDDERAVGNTWMSRADGVLRDVRIASALGEFMYHTPMTLGPLTEHGGQWIAQIERAKWLLLLRVASCKDVLFSAAVGATGGGGEGAASKPIDDSSEEDEDSSDDEEEEAYLLHRTLCVETIQLLHRLLFCRRQQRQRPGQVDSLYTDLYSEGGDGGDDVSLGRMTMHLRQRAMLEGHMVLLELVASIRLPVAVKLGAITVEGAGEMVATMWAEEAWMGAHERRAVSQRLQMFQTHTIIGLLTITVAVMICARCVW